LDNSYSDFEPSNLNSNIFLTVKKNNNKLTFSFNFKDFSENQVDDFINKFNNQLNIFLSNKKTEIVFVSEKLNEINFGTLDSALIGYLPSKNILKQLNISENTFKSMIFNQNKSIWLEGIKTSYGNTGFITIPFFAEEINLSNNKIIIEYIYSAIEHAKNLGVKYISLAGMLPAITNYGNVFNDIKYPIITTGHSATVSAVIKNTINILDKLKINTKDKVIAFIGLGSIGKATVLNLFNYIDKPNKIILCDIYGSEKRLNEIEEKLRENINFQGVIEKKISSNNISDDVYQADIMVCAVSSNTNILDVDKLKSNCIIVDDSFPHCFDVKKAITRMKEKKDVYIIGGGLLDIGKMKRFIYLPIENKYIKEHLTKNLIDGSIASCQSESLLIIKNNLTITKGLVDYKIIPEYINVIDKLNITSSKLHLADYVLELNLI
jgi:predicted amino acid dehydrogenase